VKKPASRPMLSKVWCCVFLLTVTHMIDCNFVLQVGVGEKITQKAYTMSHCSL